MATQALNGFRFTLPLRNPGECPHLSRCLIPVFSLLTSSFLMAWSLSLQVESGPCARPSWVRSLSGSVAEGDLNTVVAGKM